MWSPGTGSPVPVRLITLLGPSGRDYCIRCPVSSQSAIRLVRLALASLTQSNSSPPQVGVRALFSTEVRMRLSLVLSAFALRPVVHTALLSAGLSLFASAARAADEKAPESKEFTVDGRTIKQWIGALESRDRKECRAAAAALARAGARAIDAVPVLEKMQSEGDANQKSLAAYALAYIKPATAGSSGPQDLLAVLKNKGQSTAQRGIAAGQLAKLGSAAPAAVVDDLVAVLKNDPDAYTRALAAYVLPYVRPTPEVSRLLGETLDDKNKNVARAAAAALVVMGDKAFAAGPAVVKLTQSKDPYKRGLAVYVLANIKSDPGEALPALLKLLSDEDADIAKSAHEAIKKIDPTNPAKPIGRKT